MEQKPHQEVENDLERYETLREFEQRLEGPVIFLGFVWLALLVVELIWGLNPLLEALGTLIWIVFIVDFAIRFFLAPRKLAYLRHNWLTALSLLVPALRVLRITGLASLLRLSQATRGLRFVKVVGTFNRGMGALRSSLGQRGIRYVMALSLIVTFLGAAGLFAFENGQPGYQSYGESLWRTAMLLTTLGTGAEPKTMEGRALVFLLALYSFTVFGYITASLASIFIGYDAQQRQEQAGSQQSIEALRAEIAALRAEIRQQKEPPNRGG